MELLPVSVHGPMARALVLPGLPAFIERHPALFYLCEGHRFVDIVGDANFIGRKRMLLKGSCHCRAVEFSLEAMSPAPFMHCHCSICRKTAGSGGYAINLGTDASSLQVRGRKHLRVYHPFLREEGQPWPDGKDRSQGATFGARTSLSV
jgi:hypothetical protein